MSEAPARAIAANMYYLAAAAVVVDTGYTTPRTQFVSPKLSAAQTFPCRRKARNVTLITSASDDQCRVG